MEVIYQGVNITDSVQVKECFVSDTLGNRSDGLTMSFENAASWYAWKPENGDIIRVSQDGYDSGDMRVDFLDPEDDVYIIHANAMREEARIKKTKSYRNMSIEEIVRQCAMECGMDYQIFGIDPNIIIPYVEQNEMGTCGFLKWLLALEGAQLKCVSGKFVVIGIAYAQNRTPVMTMELTAGQEGVAYSKRENIYKECRLQTPYASASVTDPDVEKEMVLLLGSNFPAMSDVQAARWARNKLFDCNRKNEVITVQCEFQPNYTAMQRIDITGNSCMEGEWLIEGAEHDLVDSKTKLTLHRCKQTI